ncbi:hypothetical protein [Streptomyces beijiangensis]|uniref:Uncharacterized protein n=1 Tax=Streptomyces beijiangensis TaxID=163361 RepID=A0A939JFH2_9ACTN|nr:hypothetical protein [Streptomyces beijiangensis]MBO0512388.1 hypothetical protein [Streptomyces beijiangensis]
MTKATTKRDDLPEDDGVLDAFAAAANAALTPRRRTRQGAATTKTTEPTTVVTTPPVGEPDPASVAEAPAPAPATSVPGPAGESRPAAHDNMPAAIVAPLQRREAAHTGPLQIPDLGPLGAEPTQCVIMVGAEVRKRFEYYQASQRQETGHEPTNAVVVRRAVLHCKKHDRFAQLHEALRHQRQVSLGEDDDPDGLFADVPTRRVERGRIKDTVQQSFRPSRQELGVIDAIVRTWTFPTRSDFLNAALDDFLPSLTTGKVRGGR